MEREKTTIRISKELAERLKELGTMADTYEDVIWRLIKENKVLREDAMKRIEALEEELRELQGKVLRLVEKNGTQSRRDGY